MRQVDTEVTVSIGGCNPIPTDTIIVADSRAIARRDRILHQTVDSCIGIHGDDVRKDCGADRRELQA